MLTNQIVITLEIIAFRKECTKTCTPPGEVYKMFINLKWSSLIDQLRHSMIPFLLQCNIYHTLGGEIYLHLSSHYKKYFDQIKAKFRELTHTIVPLIAGGIPSLEEFKTFLVTRFKKLKPQLSIAKSFTNVMELTIKEKCTVTNIDCLETIVDKYDIEKARLHITTYKSAVNKICVEFKHDVLEVTTVSTSFKYESIMFVLEWQRTDDLTVDDIDALLWKAFGDMANRVSFKYVLKRKLIRNDNNMFSNLKILGTCIVYDMYYKIIQILHATSSSFLFCLIYNRKEAIDNSILNSLCPFYQARYLKYCFQRHNHVESQ